MISAVLIHLVTYGAVLVFLAAVVARAIRISNMPMHLRWELYPVAHEGEKARYGGSALEELDWWEKPRKKSLLGELRVMVPEMTLLVALFEHNRKLWLRSFPFHFGLYTLAGLIGLILVGALLELGGVYVGPGPRAGSVVYYLTQAAAIAGLGLGTIGVLGLIHGRLFDPDLRPYTTAASIFNLAFFLAAFAMGWLCFIFVDTGFAMTRSFVQSLLTFEFTSPVGSPLLVAEILTAAALLAYIPLTHMSHFFTKWFTYHRVRWEDEPNMPGSRLEKRVLAQVTYPVTWSAPHIKADGKKNWIDIATEDCNE